MDVFMIKKIKKDKKIKMVLFDILKLIIQSQIDAKR